MLTLTEETVRSVVEQVVAQLALGGGGMGSRRAATGAAGVHASVDDAVAAAKEAAARFGKTTLEVRGRAIQKIRDICLGEAETLGKLELDETKIGRLDHKIDKLHIAGGQTPGVEFLKVDAVSGDAGLTITEYAPFGVIGAITPVTHSLPTVASNAISMLAGGNVVVFNAHPSGAEIAKLGVRKFNEAIRAEIGIDNVINIVDPPTLESAQQLFGHRDVRLLVVTGGPGVARAALASNKRAIVAGPGNPPVVVDETACMDNAAQSIVFGGAYDNNLLCIGEKEVFAVHAIFDRLMTAMTHHGGYRLGEQQIRELEKAVFEPAPDGSGKTVLKKDLVGKDPVVMARAIGLTIPAGVQLLFGETGEESPFVDHEQMMPFVPFVRTPDAETAIRLAKKYEHNYRHTACMHSRNLEAITRMGQEMDVTIYVVNAPSTAGLGGNGGGHLSFSIATPTGEGATSALTFTRERRSSVAGGMRMIGAPIGRR